MAVNVGQGPIYLAAGDLGHNGTMEVVVAGGQYLNILKGDGTSYSDAWPISAYTASNSAGFGTIALADIDGDGQTEILTTNSLVSSLDNASQPEQTPSIVRQRSASKLSATYVDASSNGGTSTLYWAAQLNAYHLDGAIAKSWSLPGINGLEPCCTPQVTVGDFNHNGLTEIAVVDGLQENPEGGWQYHAVMEVLATGTTFNPSANLWSSLYRDTWNTATADFVVPAFAPTFNVAAGVYSQAQIVSLFDTTPGTTIYYTTDGTTPGITSLRYTGPITVSATETIKAVAVASAYTVSSVSSAAYSIAQPAAAPTFSVAQGTYTSVQTVSLSDTTPGAQIYFTTNRSTPTTNSMPYSGPITVSATETIEAVAIASGYSLSPVASADYTINLANPAPVITSTSPAYSVAGGSAFTLTVNGNGFIAGSTVYWGSSALSTQFVRATQVTAQVPASDIASAGITAITVETLAPGGGTSGTIQFEVDSAGTSSSSSPTFTTTNASISAGTTATYPVTLSSSVSNVTVNCLNLPAGATCSYSTSSGAVSIATSTSTPAGIYQMTAVFTETQTVSAGYLLAPFLLLP